MKTAAKVLYCYLFASFCMVLIMGAVNGGGHVDAPFTTGIWPLLLAPIALPLMVLTMVENISAEKFFSLDMLVAALSFLVPFLGAMSYAFRRPRWLYD